MTKRKNKKIHSDYVKKLFTSNNLVARNYHGNYSKDITFRKVRLFSLDKKKKKKKTYFIRLLSSKSSYKVLNDALRILNFP